MSLTALAEQIADRGRMVAALGHRDRHPVYVEVLDELVRIFDDADLALAWAARSRRELPASPLEMIRAGDYEPLVRFLKAMPPVHWTGGGEA